MVEKHNCAATFFSVIIPTYNSAEYIADTLFSVLDQRYENYELIVSDDGSTDDTPGIAKEIFGRYPWKRARVLANRHEGPSAARNRGIEAATGDWIAFLDSDDIWFKEKLETVAQFIREAPHANLVCHNLISIKGGQQRLIDFSSWYNNKISSFLSLYRKNSLTPSTVAVRKQLIIRAGMFDESLRSAQDYDLWLRLALLPETHIEYIKTPLCYFNIREGSVSSDIELRLECLLKISRKYYGQLKRHCRQPLIEKRRYEGKWYAWAGLQLMRKQKFGKGFLLFLTGMIKWPIRFDLINNLINRMRNG